MWCKELRQICIMDCESRCSLPRTPASTAYVIQFACVLLLPFMVVTNMSTQTSSSHRARGKETASFRAVFIAIAFWCSLLCQPDGCIEFLIHNIKAGVVTMEQ